MENLEQINKKFEEQSIGIYPFISRGRVTVLKKGFYSKKEANYRGVTMQYDSTQNVNKALLIGYYYVPSNYVIVPEGLTVTEGKKKLISDKLNKGFELVSKVHLFTYEFGEDTEEYAVAKLHNEQYKNSL